MIAIYWVIDGDCVYLQGSRNSSRSSSPSVRMMPDKPSGRGYFSPDDAIGSHDNRHMRDDVQSRVPL